MTITIQNMHIFRVRVKSLSQAAKQQLDFSKMVKNEKLLITYVSLVSVVVVVCNTVSVNQLNASSGFVTHCLAVKCHGHILFSVWLSWSPDISVFDCHGHMLFECLAVTVT